MIAFFRATLSIQIEGLRLGGKAPTWRWDGPGVRRWFGKPVTGYHLCLVTAILLCVHLPQLYAALGARGDLLAMFFLLTVTGIFSGSCATATSAWAGSARADLWFSTWTLVPGPIYANRAIPLRGLAPALWTGMGWTGRHGAWSSPSCSPGRSS